MYREVRTVPCDDCATAPTLLSILGAVRTDIPTRIRPWDSARPLPATYPSGPSNRKVQTEVSCSAPHQTKWPVSTRVSIRIPRGRAGSRLASRICERRSGRARSAV